MSSNENSTPGFAILSRRRSRDILCARTGAPGLAELRSLGSDGIGEDDLSLDVLTGSLLHVEAQVEDAARAELIDDETADALRAAIAQTGASVIDARFRSPEERDALVLDLSRTIGALNHELSAMRQQAAEDAAQIAFLREQVTTLLRTLAETRDASRLDRARVSALEVEAVRLQAALDDADVGGRDAELRELRESVQDLDLALRDMRFRLLDQNREIEAMRAVQDVAAAELSDTEALLRATHNELVKTRGRLAQAEREVQDLQSELGSAAAEVTLMETWMNQALARCAQLEAELASMSSSGHRVTAA